VGGCTECAQKGGCDDRKGEMMTAIAEALAALYPTRTWGERDDEQAFGGGVTLDEGRRLAAAIEQRLGTAAVHKPGGTDEYCDYVYVLCLGRSPSLIELRERAAAPYPPALHQAAADAGGDDDGVDLRVPGGALRDVYLRVALSSLARFAAVQEVVITAHDDHGELVICETPRTGVFAPSLLPRFRKLVSVLAEAGWRHLDFGDMTQPPDGFHAGDYAARYTGVPVIANYLFYPQPCSAVTTVVAPGAPAAVPALRDGQPALPTPGCLRQPPVASLPTLAAPLRVSSSR